MKVYAQIDDGEHEQGVNVSDEQLAAVNITRNTFPRDLYLDLAERGLVSPAMARSHQSQLREDTVVGVSLQGMMHLRQAAEDLGRFVSAVRYVADRAGRFRPPSATELARLSITSEEIRPHLALEPGDRALLRLGALISQQAWQLWTSFAGPDSDGWSFEVNLERARRYRAIYTSSNSSPSAIPRDNNSNPPCQPHQPRWARYAPCPPPTTKR